MREARQNPRIGIVILMGVSGSGKTTIGQLLANDLGWAFYEGDDFHPQRNVAKMGSGVPLSDLDRVPWLQAMHALVQDLITKSQRAVITCSALKEAYREWFTGSDPRVSLVYLRGTYALIHQRLRSRTMHFMKPEMLASQFSALEEPRDIPFVDMAQAPEVIVEQIKRMLHLTPA